MATQRAVAAASKILPRRSIGEAKLKKLAALYQSCAEFPGARDDLLAHIDHRILDSTSAQRPRLQTLGHMLQNEKEARARSQRASEETTKTELSADLERIKEVAQSLRPRMTKGTDHIEIRRRKRMQAIANALLGTTNLGQPGPQSARKFEKRERPVVKVKKVENPSKGTENLAIGASEQLTEQTPIEAVEDGSNGTPSEGQTTKV